MAQVNSKVYVSGYELIGTAACDVGWVLTMHNNSDTVLVVDVEEAGELGDLDGVEGRVVATFSYANRAARVAVAEGLAAMVARALEFTAEVGPDAEACPGCGCLPGDGRTHGCHHPEGCGYFSQLAGEAERRGAQALADLDRKAARRMADRR